MMTPLTTPPHLLTFLIPCNKPSFTSSVFVCICIWVLCTVDRTIFSTSYTINNQLQGNWVATQLLIIQSFQEGVIESQFLSSRDN